MNRFAGLRRSGPVLSPGTGVERRTAERYRIDRSFAVGRFDGALPRVVDCGARVAVGPSRSAAVDRFARGINR